jgi:hypothetical protein
MSSEDSEDKRGFKVDDRRRFSATGEPRAPQEGAQADGEGLGAGTTAASPQAASGPTETGQAPPAEPPPGEPPPGEARGGTTAATGKRERYEIPPIEITFSTFVISLGTQALAHLGEIPNPIDNQVVVDLGAAQQVIDILGILKDKTKGNLDTSEAALLGNLLYDLRLKYVERVRHPS